MNIKLNMKGVLAPVLCADEMCAHRCSGEYYGVCTSLERAAHISGGTNGLYLNSCRYRKPRIIKDDGNKTESGLLEEE